MRLSDYAGGGCILKMNARAAIARPGLRTGDERDRVPRGRRLRERLSRPEDSAAIERSLKVMAAGRSAKRSSTLSAVSSAETNLLGPSAPA